MHPLNFFSLEYNDLCYDFTRLVIALCVFVHSKKQDAFTLAYKITASPYGKGLSIANACNKRPNVGARHVIPLSCGKFVKPIRTAPGNLVAHIGRPRLFGIDDDSLPARYAN
jgi:hypothetical protein